ncbi:coiled-coil domain-containing protein 134 [Ooceraea biroi]|nr:coiled-coil domain-containing protein 134 [Ooceraea biroi]
MILSSGTWQSLGQFPRDVSLVDAPRVPLRVAVVAIVLMLTITARAQQETDESKSRSKLDEELFEKLFAQRRKDHMEAVRTLLKMDNYRLYQTISVLTEKMVDVIESSRSVVEKGGFSSNSSFPEDTNVRDALSSILENTAFFGDVILHLPNVTHRILRARQKWNSTIHWSLSFVNQTRHLLDKSTIAMIRLVEQELNITERDPSYFNPYASSGSTCKDEDTAKRKRSVKRAKRRKGPQMTKIEL